MSKFSGSYIWPKVASAPGSPVQGQVYFNTTDSKFYGYSGVAWVDLTATGGGVVVDPATDWKYSVKCATTANITVLTAPGATMDGYTFVAGDRFLVKDQTAPAENGIYTWASATSATRATDADATTELTGGTTVYVSRGTLARDTVWAQASDTPTTLGTDPIYFTRIVPSYTTGNWKAPWSPSTGLYANMERTVATGTLTLSLTATNYWIGGFILAAGVPITSVSFYVNVAGTAPTVRHVSLVRQSDRVCLARSNNSTTIYTATSMNSQSLSAIYTPTVDVPVWVVLGNANATTAVTLGASVVGQQGLFNTVPVMQATGGATPTTTPPVVGAAQTIYSGTSGQLPFCTLN